ncbi:calcium/calmodulin-dependent protein kinase type II [Actinoplanes sichuanensis]|uniref:SgcJ/EcaC family oxidoreductase n=1 Tax=Actinoplanes sichuanensis TaxID=512349 RepID=A0ABW4A197_9ACTN|nr:SgcJ/EcaC family oxidoreductase [Actinoplanes sichuanensis]BEL04171.1 calcium/calmodulin-dependent protein kinase type II [Actinoplanes sichuanensis]
MTRRVRIRVLGAGAAAVLAVTAAPWAVSSATASPATVSAVRTKASEQQIRALFTRWNRSLTTLDPQRVADRYAPDGVLVPTVSNQVRTNRAEIVDYFQHFLENRPQAVITESHVKVLDPTTAIDTGTYRFTLRSDSGTRVVDARYTFVYERINGKWLIVNHHSSAMPE